LGEGDGCRDKGESNEGEDAADGSLGHGRPPEVALCPWEMEVIDQGAEPGTVSRVSQETKAGDALVIPGFLNGNLIGIAIE
jgi:hypothetical protein